MSNKTCKIEPDEIINIEEAALANPERLFNEINLFRLEGCLFNFSKNRKKQDPTQKFETYNYHLKTADGSFKLEFKIFPSVFGKPGQLAYKLLDAVLRKFADYPKPFPPGVPLGQRELTELIGRKHAGGRNKSEYEKAILQLKQTTIQCSFFIKDSTSDKLTKGDWNEVFMSVFGDCYLSGYAKNHITQGFFTLSPQIIQSFNNSYYFCLNFARLKHLEPIGRTLFKRLFFHFSNIYSNTKTPRVVLKKSYSDVCKYWLGGMVEQKYKSDIEKALKAHFQAIKKTGLIKKAVLIEKNAQGDGFNLVFEAGKGFFEDYKRFYVCPPQLELPFQASRDQRFIEQPMSLVNYFYQKLLQTDQVENRFLDQTEVDLASAFLSEFTYEEIKAWIDYAIEQAEKTSFQMKKFGGIKNFKTEFLTLLKNRSKHQTEVKKQADIDHEKELEFAYQTYVRKEREKFEKEVCEDKERLAFFKQQKANFIEEATRQHRNKAMVKMTVRMAYNKIIDEQAGVLSFKDWKKKQAN